MFMQIATSVKNLKKGLKIKEEPGRIKRIRKKTVHLSQIIKLVFYSLLLPSLIVVGFKVYNLTLNSEFFNLRQITILGNHILNRDDIIDNTSLLYGTNIFSIDLATIRAMTKSSPYIKQLYVRRELPASIIIELVERKPLAIIDHKNSSFLIGEDGMLLEKFTEAGGIQYPTIITSLKENVNVGQLIGDRSFQLPLIVLSEMRLNHPECYARLVSIQVHEPYHIALKMRHLPGTVIIRADEMGQNLERLNSLLPKLVDTPFEYIDLRFSDKAIVKFIS